MAKNRLTGLTIEIGGDTTQLTKALKAPNDSIRELQTQIKALDKALEIDPTNIDLLEQKMRILSKTIEQTEDKLTILKTAQEQFIKSGKDIDSKEYIELEKQIALTQQSLNKLNNQKVQLDIDISDVKSADGDLEKLKDTIDDTSDAAENSADGFTIMKGAVSDLVSNAIQNLIGALGDLIGSLFEVSEATEEYRSMMAKVEGSADTFGYSLEFAKDQYADFYKYLGDDQMATNAITNLMGMKVSTDTVSNSANAAIAVWSAYGDSIPIEGLTESITESARVAQVTGSLADAINWAERSNEEWAAALSSNTAAQAAFNKAIAEGESQEDAYSAALAACADTQERADLIAQTLNTTYGASKETYDEVAGSIIDANEAELEFKDTQAEMGEAMQPVNTALTSLKNDALIAILPLIQGLADAFAGLLTWMQQNPAAINAIVAAISGLVVAIGTLALALNIGPIITTVTTALKGLWAAISANPFVLVASLIAGVVTSIIYLWNTSEGFRNFWIGVWNDIVTTVTNMANEVSLWFNNLRTNIETTFENIGQWFGEKFTQAKDAIFDAFSTVVQFFADIWLGIQQALSTVKQWFSNMFTNAWNAVKTAFNTAVSFFSGIWSGITGVFSGVASWFGNAFTNAFNAVKNAFSGFTSFFSGLWNSISSTFSKIGTNIANAISGAVKSGLNGVISQIENIINSGINLINGAINLINKIPGVNIGKIGRLNLPRLATGGTVTDDILANIGESGREVVLPLDRNTEWADILASHIMQPMMNNLATLLAEIQKANNFGGNITVESPIEIDLDGKPIYQDVVRRTTRSQKNRSAFQGA